MEPTNKELLAAVRLVLSRDLPQLCSNPTAARTLDLALLAVDELIRRTDGGREHIEQLRRKLNELAERAVAVLAPVSQSAPLHKWPDRPAERLPSDPVEAEVESLWERLAAMVPQLQSRIAGAQDQQERALSSELLEAICQAEVEEMRFPPVADAQAEEGERLEDRIARLDQYFSGRMATGEKWRVESVRRLSGGYSNDTMRVDLASEGGASRTIVLRISHEYSLLHPYVTSPQEEVQFVNIAAASGIPVARPLWLEPDTSLLGNILTATEFIPGSLLGDTLGVSQGISEAALRNYAAVIARLHGIAWWDWDGPLPERFAPRRDMSINDSLDLIMAGLRSFVESAWITPSPVVELLFGWLDRNRPLRDYRPVITHGDLAFHNWLFDGDEPVALLDWETTVIASPTKDLAVLRDVAVPRDMWGVFMEAYKAAGGIDPDEEEMNYYAVLRQLHAIVTTSICSQKMFTVRDPLNLNYLDLGIRNRSYFYQRFSESLTKLLA